MRLQNHFGSKASIAFGWKNVSASVEISRNRFRFTFFDGFRAGRGNRLSPHRWCLIFSNSANAQNIMGPLQLTSRQFLATHRDSTSRIGDLPLYITARFVKSTCNRHYRVMPASVSNAILRDSPPREFDQDSLDIDSVRCEVYVEYYAQTSSRSILLRIRTKHGV